MRTNTKTLATVVSTGALVLTLAACGQETPQVEEATGNGGTSANTDDTAGSDDAAGTDDAASTDDAADTDAAADTDDAAGTEDAPAGGEVAAGTEIAPADFIAQLKSPGVENMTSFTMNMDMQMEGQAVTMVGKADLGGSSPAMDITMEMPGMGNVHMIMLDGQAYVAMPGLTEEGKFVQMPLEDIMGEDAGDFTNQVDMTAQWDDWEAGAQKITFIGVEDVDGESLNHYEMLLDTSAVDTSDLGGDAASLPSEITYDVWLDDQNFMRKVTFDIMGAESVMTMDGWGEDVNIEAPDASQLTEIPGMPTSP